MYEVEIKEASFEMTARDRLRYKDTTTAIALEDASADGSCIIFNPVGYVILSIHNDKVKDGNPDYEKYVIIDGAGNSYITGSASFWNSFINIFNEMKNEPEYSIEVAQYASKNYKGKNFIKCNIV